jgi:nickel/cobalt exporter
VSAAGEAGRGTERGPAMSRAALAGLITVLLLALGATAAGAHPLGNFSVNHLVSVRMSDDRVDLRYVLDQAEIPTFQERGDSKATVLARKRAEIQRGLRVVLDGRAVTPRELPGARLTSPPGQGGLPLTRLETTLTATRAGAKRVEVRDNTFRDRVGWKAIVARPGAGTAVRSSAPSGDPTDGLRRYPQDALSSPRDQRTATFAVAAGNGTLTASDGKSSSTTTGGGSPSTTTNRGGSDGFAGIFQDAANGRGALILLILAAFAWGAVHALSPGHGKTMVAAYLVGTRGTAKHAVGLGATVTITHTIGVFALGLVTLLLAQYVLPEDLYPWLSLVSGLMVLAIGASVLRMRLRARRAHAQAHAHAHQHDHAHGHDHDHTPPDHLTTKGLVAMGASAGLIPCPSALVVLLAALTQHQIPLGLGLIVVFSLGLAATLTGLGLIVVYAKRLSARFRVPSRVTTVLPALSSLAIVGVGVLMTAKALPQIA